MIRGKWVWDSAQGRLVEAAIFYAQQPEKARSRLSAPAIRADGMTDTWCPADGQHYDSKSAYYRAVKQAGCEIDDRPMERAREDHRVKDAGPVGQDIKDAIDQLEARL